MHQQAAQVGIPAYEHVKAQVRIRSLQRDEALESALCNLIRVSKVSRMWRKTASVDFLWKLPAERMWDGTLHMLRKAGLVTTTGQHQSSISHIDVLTRRTQLLSDYELALSEPVPSDSWSEYEALIQISTEILGIPAMQQIVPMSSSAEPQLASSAAVAKGQWSFDLPSCELENLQLSIMMIRKRDSAFLQVCRRSGLNGDFSDQTSSSDGLLFDTNGGFFADLTEDVEGALLAHLVPTMEETHINLIRDSILLEHEITLAATASMEGISVEQSVGELMTLRFTSLELSWRVTDYEGLDIELSEFQSCSLLALLQWH